MQREVRVAVSCSQEVLRQRAISKWVDDAFREATDNVENNWIRSKTTSLTRLKTELASFWMARYQTKIEQCVSSLLSIGGVDICHCPFSVFVKEYITVDGSLVFTIFVDTPNVRVGNRFEIARILNV